MAVPRDSVPDHHVAYIRRAAIEAARLARRSAEARLLARLARARAVSLSRQVQERRHGA